MWNKISNEEDLACFLKKINFFHDSCIKEMRYISGAYVDNQLAMYPVNDKRLLNIIVQCQFKDISMIEMQFIGLKCLKLYPIDERYTCEILDATMFFKEGSIYWCDCGIMDEKDLEDYEGVFVCASAFQWRIIENRMGGGEFYINE